MDDAFLSANILTQLAGVDQGARAAAAGGVVPVESRLMDHSHGREAAEPLLDGREALAFTQPVARTISSSPHISTLTMLDVAVAWRELPGRSSGKELALLHALHAKAHGASCTCLATCKAHARWRTAIRPATQDRKPIFPGVRARWAEQPFFFDLYTQPRTEVESGPSDAPSEPPEAPPVDPAAAAAAASEELPLYLRRGQGPPTITHWNPLGEICLPFLFFSIC